MLREPLIAHVSKRQAQSPGPGAYDISRKLECPPIKMRGRYEKRQIKDDRELLNLPSSLGNVPKITLGGRNDGCIDKFATPGPSYIPPNFGANAKKSSFGAFGDKGKTVKRAKTVLDACSTPGPGPSAYNTRDHTFDANGTRGIRMKGHHDFKYDMASSPGPCAYMPRYNSVLATAPKPVFHIRPKEKEPEPGVGFKDLKSTLSGPRFTMKARNTDDINLV